MSKTPMTWLGLIKLKLAEEKAKGKSPSIGDVTPLAKKEWVQIKEGKHPKYMQGKAQTFARKKKGNNKSIKADSDADDSSSNSKSSSSSSSSSKKSRSNSSNSSRKSSRSNSSNSSKSSNSNDNQEDIHALLSKIKMCGKCKKKVANVLGKKKSMKGGYTTFYNTTPLISGAELGAPDAGPKFPMLAGGGKKNKTKKQRAGCGTCVMGGGAPPALSPAAVTADVA